MQEQMMPGQAAMSQLAGAQTRIVTPFDMIVSNAQKVEDAKKKEVSLKTLKKSQIQKIMTSFQRGRQVADNYYRDTIKPKIEERNDAYHAKEAYYRKKFPIISETSRFCSRDIKTAIDWMLPSLCEPFVGSDDPVDIRGVNVDDDPAAKKIQQLLKYQLQRKNCYPLFIDAVWKDALRLNYAVAKVYWKRDEERERYQMVVEEGDLPTIAALMEAQAVGQAEIVSFKPLKDAPDLKMIVFDKIKVKANYPVVQYMSPSELRFTPDARSVQEAKFKAHRKIVSGDYLKRKEAEGVYRDVSKAMESGGDATHDSYDTDRNRELSTIDQRLAADDQASRMIELL